MLTPKELINRCAIGLDVALGVRNPKNPQEFIGDQKSSDIVKDLVPIYDTIFFDFNSATTVITLPNQAYQFFTGEQTVTWADGAANPQIRKTTNWNNFGGTYGSTVGLTKAYAAIGLFYEFHPYPGFLIENWLLNTVNPHISVEVGRRRIKRFETKLKHFVRYQAISGLYQAPDAGAGTVANMIGDTDHNDLPTQMWNYPLIIKPFDSINITVDFTNNMARAANYPALSATELLLWQGQDIVTPAYFFGMSVGFMGVYGYKVS
jgi:hypothetical protein